jgi:hypothetical protein
MIFSRTTGAFRSTARRRLKGANANRYASDLVIVNQRGEMFHDDPYHKTNYYSYGQSIYAAADGVVRASRNDIPDNEFEGKRIRYPQLPPGADEDLGNFVLIDHQNGEFSVLPTCGSEPSIGKRANGYIVAISLARSGFPETRSFRTSTLLCCPAPTSTAMRAYRVTSIT